MNGIVMEIMRTIRNMIGVRLLVLATLVVGLSATAMAQCSASFSAMAEAAVSARSQLPALQLSARRNSAAAASDTAVNTSIVGMWHIKFNITVPGVPDPITIQEAFQIWNTGGTEVHNPNVDPRGGSVCLGAWKEAAPQTFKLTHRVWLWQTDGTFLGIGHLTETLTLGDRGNTHSGTFILDLYDASDSFVGNLVTGDVVGERISPN